MEAPGIFNMIFLFDGGAWYFFDFSINRRKTIKSPQHHFPTPPKYLFYQLLNNIYPKKNEERWKDI